MSDASAPLMHFPAVPSVGVTEEGGLRVDLISEDERFEFTRDELVEMASSFETVIENLRGGWDDIHDFKKAMVESEEIIGDAHKTLSALLEAAINRAIVKGSTPARIEAPQTVTP